MLSVGENERETFPFATWRETSPQRIFNMPDRVQNLTTIHFMASTTDKNQVELCILYDGKPKKRVEFDDSEDISVNAADKDDESCRCTE